MTSSSTRELGPRFFVSAGMSCIRFLAFAHGRGLFSCRAVDNIENLIPFPRQQSNMLEHARSSDDCTLALRGQVSMRIPEAGFCPGGACAEQRQSGEQRKVECLGLHFRSPIRKGQRLGCPSSARR